MAEKCAICTAPIETIFLEKINGTYVRINGKKKVACSRCQKQHREALRSKLS